MEDQIKELMGLVREIGVLSAQESYRRENGNIDGANDALIQEMEVEREIESKLRAMLERKPNSDERIASIAENYRTSYPSSGFDF